MGSAEVRAHRALPLLAIRDLIGLVRAAADGFREAKDRAVRRGQLASWSRSARPSASVTVAREPLGFTNEWERSEPAAKDQGELIAETDSAAPSVRAACRRFATGS